LDATEHWIIFIFPKLDQNFQDHLDKNLQACEQVFQESSQVLKVTNSVSKNTQERKRWWRLKNSTRL